MKQNQYIYFIISKQRTRENLSTQILYGVELKIIRLYPKNQQRYINFYFQSAVLQYDYYLLRYKFVYLKNQAVLCNLRTEESYIRNQIMCYGATHICISIYRTMNSILVLSIALVRCLVLFDRGL